MRYLFFLFIHVVFIINCHNNDQSHKTPPNFIIIFTDDQGYGDLSCFGGKHVHTPNIDQMAKEGMKLTSFYVAAPVCTPSRAALLTGCYPKRIDMSRGGLIAGEKPFVVTLAGDPKGLNPNEITIAEILKTKGYKTGCFGKWHLGDQPEFLPTNQGFDEFFGIPYSHDIHPFHPGQGSQWNFPPLPLLEGDKVIEMDPNADNLTERITARVIQFIGKNKERPFFAYVPHPMPHSPLHISSAFSKLVSDSIQSSIIEDEGYIDYSARNALYPAVISEIDASVGRIIQSLKENKIDDNTFVLFTTDNGPGPRLASAGVLRGRKGSTFEGGMRVPAVVRWPNTIPKGKESDLLITAMDLLPTLSNLAGAKIPQDRIIDGKDIWPILKGQVDATSPHDRFFYTHAGDIRAVRSGKWKYHQKLLDGQLKNGENTALFDLETDISESSDIAKQYPEVVQRLKSYLENFEIELGIGDEPTDGVRRAGWVNDPKPLDMD